MTLPIVTEIQMLEDGNGFLKEVVTAYYLPAALQDNPPEPADPDIYITHRDTLRVFSRWGWRDIDAFAHCDPWLDCPWHRSLLQMGVYQTTKDVW